jgi:cobalt/nickel transport protein
MKHFDRKLWIGLAVMTLLSPLGVILPEKWKAGSAWGEWDAATLQKLLGYVPDGLRQMADFWNAPIANYNFGGEEATLLMKAISYVLSGIIGIIIVAVVMFIISKLVLKNDR